MQNAGILLSEGYTTFCKQYISIILQASVSPESPCPRSAAAARDRVVPPRLAARGGHAHPRHPEPGGAAAGGRRDDSSHVTRSCAKLAQYSWRQ